MAEQLILGGSWYQTGWEGVEKKIPECRSKFDVSELKSALQKYIRRGHVGKAVMCADEMLRIGSHGSLLKRLPSIVSEDCGWRKMWVVALCDRLRWGNKYTQNDRFTVLKAIAKLAEGPKDKDASFLQDDLSRKKLGIDCDSDEDLCPLPSAADTLPCAPNRWGKRSRPPRDSSSQPTRSPQGPKTS